VYDKLVCGLIDSHKYSQGTRQATYLPSTTMANPTFDTSGRRSLPGKVSTTASNGSPTPDTTRPDLRRTFIPWLRVFISLASARTKWPRLTRSKILNPATDYLGRQLITIRLLKTSQRT